MFSLPVTLIVLVFAFGALVAAGLPLLLALTAVFATMGLLAIPSQLMPLDADIGVIVLLIGLAVGVDYSLFYLKREREERAAGRSERAALEAAAATSGRAVLDLRPDRDGRDGRDALHRRQDVHGLRHRDDDRGRRRRARLAHRPAGPARRARRQRRQAAGAVRAQAPPPGRRRPDVERDPRSRPAPPARLGRPRRRAPARARRSGAAHAHRHAGHRDAAAEPLGGEDLQQAAEGVPRRGELRPGAWSRPTTSAARRSRRRSPTCSAQAIATGQFSTPTDVEYSTRTARSRVVSIAMQGDGTDDEAVDRARDAAQRRSSRRPSASSTAPTSASPATTANEQGLERPDEARRAVRVRVRAHARVPADAAHVPVDRDRDQGGPAQPALGRRRLRRPRARLPARLGQGPARLPSRRRDHRLPADLPLRDPVRALDGLPRVHPQPRPRGVRPRHDDRRRGRARDQVDRRRRDQRRAGDGRRLLDLRDAAVHVPEGVRRRPRRRRPRSTRRSSAQCCCRRR